MLRLPVVLAALMLSLPACAKVYQWRDADGQVHYSDQPPAGQNSRERTIRPNVVGNAKAVTASGPQAKAPGVVLYTNPQCGSTCAEAVKLLDARGVDYEMRNPASSEAQLLAFYQATGQTQLIPPVMQVGNDVFRIWDPQLWSAALTKAGYAPVQR
ncbi:glutaredoxin family protein [Jeongeupia naejangsanensis]|uniref:Glutaredoxin family protein n=1 Tax=Jeongeupia naejangsanensis TaxID=613195 RepID=A0ABS2BMC1_9NEIS|nr:glutaredoxin family protein [Jeongeupia naejangsanensis]MBM3116769.1 glutaredoxin family protein [Jeongeupia naejangsanensis]